MSAGLVAWNPFNAALQQSSYRLGYQDRISIISEAAQLTRYYEGNQLFYMAQEIDRLFANPELRAKYKRLMVFFNITRLLVDRVTVVGKQPVRVTFTTADGEKDEAAAAVWEEITAERIPDGLDVFVSTLGVYTELCKTVVAGTHWDEDDGMFDLRIYTPNVIDIAYAQGSRNFRKPDAYRVLLDETDERFEVWDFSDRANPQKYEMSGFQEAEKGNSEAMPWTYPDGRVLVPFTPFRTGWPQHEFFIADGQQELLAANNFVNRMWTSLSVQLFYAAFKMGILEGGGWLSKEGKPPVLPLDASNLIITPEPSFDQKGAAPNIRWDGPAAEGVIVAMLKVLNEFIEDTVASFHIQPDSVRARADASSGFALFVASTALREKQTRSINLATQPLRKVVRDMVTIWNMYARALNRPKIADDVNIGIEIPPMPMLMDPKGEVELDALKVSNRFVTRKRMIEKYNAEASEAEINELITQAAAADAAAVAIPGATAPAMWRRLAAVPPVPPPAIPPTPARAAR